VDFTLLAWEIGISLKHTSQETVSGSVGFFCSVILTPLWDLSWLGYFLAKGNSSIVQPTLSKRNLFLTQSLQNASGGNNSNRSHFMIYYRDA